MFSQNKNLCVVGEIIKMTHREWKERHKERERERTGVAHERMKDGERIKCESHSHRERCGMSAIVYGMYARSTYGMVCSAWNER